MENAPPRQALRRITRHAVRAQIADTAMDLFVRQGFDETTVDQIAAAVGISSRSVFRYFETKEDMVVDNLNVHETGQRLATDLAARPLEESAWEALRRAMDRYVETLDQDDGTLLSISAMLSTTASLQGALAVKRERWIESLIPGVINRVEGEGPVREVRARAIVHAAMACLFVASDQWVQSGGTTHVGKLLDIALTAVRT